MLRRPDCAFGVPTVSPPQRHLVPKLDCRQHRTRHRQQRRQRQGDGIVMNTQTGPLVGQSSATTLPSPYRTSTSTSPSSSRYQEWGRCILAPTAGRWCVRHLRIHQVQQPFPCRPSRRLQGFRLRPYRRGRAVIRWFHRSLTLLSTTRSPRLRPQATKLHPRRTQRKFRLSHRCRRQSRF